MSIPVRLPLSIALTFCAASSAFANRQVIPVHTTTTTNVKVGAQNRIATGTLHGPDHLATNTGLQTKLNHAPTTGQPVGTKKSGAHDGVQLSLFPTESEAKAVAAKESAAPKKLGWFRRNFTISTDMRAAMKTVDQKRAQGQINDAAQSLVSATPKPMGFRERRALSSTRHELAKDTMSLLRSRSRDLASGRSPDTDITNTKDAVAGLKTLKANDKLSFFGSIRAYFAERRAYKNTKLAMLKATPQKDGFFARGSILSKTDIGGAREQLEIIGSLKGKGSKAYRRAQDKLVARTYGTAERIARLGELDAVNQVLSQISDMPGFSDGKAQSLLKLAAQHAAHNSIRMALHYARSDRASAAQSIVDAMNAMRAVGEDPESLFRGGGWFSTGRAITKLRQKLGPQILAIENAPPPAADQTAQAGAPAAATQLELGLN